MPYKIGRNIIEAQVRENRDKVIQAFKVLRKMGFVARANYLCCSNCAGTAISEYVTKLPKKKREKVLGCVFWHDQVEWSIWKHGELTLYYGGLDLSEHGFVGIPDHLCGQIIVATLNHFGLKTEWDGNPRQAITVWLQEPIKKK